MMIEIKCPHCQDKIKLSATALEQMLETVQRADRKAPPLNKEDPATLKMFQSLFGMVK